jgi:hypothetical protein
LLWRLKQQLQRCNSLFALLLLTLVKTIDPKKNPIIALDNAAEHLGESLLRLGVPLATFEGESIQVVDTILIVLDKLCDEALHYLFE